MNQANQLQGESKKKKVLKIGQKDKGASDGNHYNPMKHCEQHNRFKNNGEI